MSQSHSIEFQEVPATLPAYLKALRVGSRLEEGETIPRLEASIRGLETDPGNLRDYRQVCGFSDSDKLPVTYPHILAFPLHMHLLTRDSFPLRLLGLVHVRNRITQYRAITVSEPMDILTYIEGHRDVHNGIEFDMVTEVRDASKTLVWEEVSTNLSRGKGTGQKPKRSASSDALDFGQYASFSAPANIGRRYASVAGDVNPIHISALSAKLFGFPKAIAHGMWLLARCAVELVDPINTDAFDLTVAFRQPVLLPGEVILKMTKKDKGFAYSLDRDDGGKTHLSGELITSA